MKTNICENTMRALEVAKTVSAMNSKNTVLYCQKKGETDPEFFIDEMNSKFQANFD